MPRYHFEDFEFNADTRELIRDGESTRLRRKVAEVLQLLIENRERALSKDEMLSAVWEQSEYRESSLLQCIRDIRKLLGDDAQNPRFIQTLHRMGYQWIFPDTTEHSGAASVGIETKGAKDKKPRSKLLGLAAAFLISLFALAFYLTSSDDSIENRVENNSASQTHSIAVLPFLNATGDESMQWVELGFPDMLAHRLRGAMTAQIVPMQQVQSALASLNLSEPYRDADYQKLMQNFGMRYLVSGVVDKLDDKYRLRYKVYAADTFATGESLHSSMNDALNPSADNIIASLERIRSSALLSSSTKALPMLPFTEESAATHAYAAGVQALQSKGAPLALRYFEAALLHDPKFIAAKLKLASTYAQLARWQESERLYQEVLRAIAPDTKAASQDPQLLAETLLGLGVLALESGDYEDANNYFQQALETVKPYQLRFLEAEILRNLSRIKAIRGDSISRYALLKQADALSRPFRSPSMEAEALYYLGSVSNEGLEINPDIDMAQNQDRLERALDYYRKLKHKPGEAQTLLALGQNYLFPLPRREKALIQAEQLFKEQHNISQLIETLNYRAFFYVQLHLSERSLPLLNEAVELAKGLPSNERRRQIRFVEGLANLDLGTDRGNGTNTQHLDQAIQHFSAQLQGSTSCDIPLNPGGMLLLGWAYAEATEYDQAREYIVAARACFDPASDPASFRIAQNSLMEIALINGDWQAALKLAEGLEEDHLNLQYRARAHYELGQSHEALALSLHNKAQHPERWNPDYEARLQQYQESLAAETQFHLDPEPSSHLVYCEDLWNTEGIKALISEGSEDSELKSPAEKPVLAL